MHSAQGLGHRARRRVLAPALSSGILLRLQFPVRTSLPRETTQQVQPSPRSKVRGKRQGSGGREGSFSADLDACDQMDLRLAGPQGARAGVDLLLSSGSCPQ